MIRLEALGTISLTDQSDPAAPRVLGTQPKRIAFLTYLAVNGRRGFVSRDDLLSLFWPESNQEDARHSLNQGLYVLRKALGSEVFETAGDTRLRPSPALFACDAVEFMERVEAGEEQAALELYRGELLEGFHLDNNRPFEEWLENERRRLRQLAIDCAVSLANKSSGREASRWLRRARQLAPYDEGVLRKQLLASMEIAGGGAALREYHVFSDRLERELEIQPSAELRRFVKDLIEEERSAGGRPAADSDLGLVLPETEKARSTRGGWKPVVFASAAIALVAVGAVVIRGGRPSGALDPNRVLVLDFENEGPASALDDFGRVAADWVGRGLLETGRIQVVSGRGALQADESLSWGQRALGARAGLVIAGSFAARDDSLAVHAQILDARDSRVVWSLTAGGPADEPSSVLEELLSRVIGGVASFHDPSLTAWTARATRPPLYAAYREFLEGLESREIAEDRHRSRQHFERAAALDSDFVLPRLWLTAILSCSTCPATAGRADSIARELFASRQDLGEFDRHVLTALRAWLGGHNRSSLELWRRVLSIAPNSEWATTAGMVAVASNRPEEAVEILTAADLDAPWLAYWPSYWRYLTEAYHLLGEFEAALESAREAKGRHPGSTWPLMYEIQALAALGRVDQVRNLIDVELPARGEPGPSRGYVIGVAGAELRAHGHREGGAFLNEAVQWFLDRPQDTPRWRLLYAQALWAAGRWAEARPILEGLAEEQPDSWPMRALVGLAAAETGNRQTALRVLAELEEHDPPNAYGWDEVYQWAILASLGDSTGAFAKFQLAIEEGFRQWPGVHTQCSHFCDHPKFLELIRPRG
jgi:DNA-binding SARP family transcriptional activator/TolB-like protein